MKACNICGRTLSIYSKGKACFFHSHKPWIGEKRILPLCSGRPEVFLHEEGVKGILRKYYGNIYRLTIVLLIWGGYDEESICSGMAGQTH